MSKERRTSRVGPTRAKGIKSMMYSLPFENKAQHTKSHACAPLLDSPRLPFLSSPLISIPTCWHIQGDCPQIVGWRCNYLARLGKVRCRQHGMTARRQACTRHKNSHTRTCSCTVSCIGLRVRLHLIGFSFWWEDYGGKEKGGFCENGAAVAL